MTKAKPQAKPPSPRKSNKARAPADSSAGHRSRLRRRFLKDYGHTMADYELLELLLMMAQPRRDMKPLAKSLIAEFGSFANCIRSDISLLKHHKNCGESVAASLKIAHAAALRLLREEAFASDHILNGWDKVLDYCQALLAREKSEQLRVLFLDINDRLMCDELFYTGTIDHAPFYPREIVKRALDLGASGLILVHNHPSGDASPSKEDIEVTMQLKKALDALDINLHDHVIVSRNSYVSMRNKSIF